MFSRFLMVLSCVVLGTGVNVHAQPDLTKQAYTDPANTDPDFPYQGEYIGTVFGQQSGLQVVAQGSGAFIAVLYPGGLPGSGWLQPQKTKLQGQLDPATGTVTLAAVDLTIQVKPKTATVLQNGGTAGTMRKVTRTSPTLGLQPPRQAFRLFEGTDVRLFTNGRITEDGLLMEGADFKPTYKDFRLHLEFRLPYMPHARGQGRSNSGVYLQSRYEVQILDSFGLDGVFNECGALYRYIPPAVNMCYPPLTWQTYDIDFQPALFDYDGKKIRNARITVWHNGVKVHDAVDLERKTGAGKPEAASRLPIRLQNHGNPVRFRNIWIIDRERPFIEPVPIEVLRAQGVSVSAPAVPVPVPANSNVIPIPIIPAIQVVPLWYWQGGAWF